MKIKIVNYDHIKKKDINDRIIRVKALIINSKKEILLAKAYTTIQFPGGHLEENESLNEALKRELKEEIENSSIHDVIDRYNRFVEIIEKKQTKQ